MQAFSTLAIGLLCAGMVLSAQAREPVAHTGDGTEVWKNSAGECWNMAGGKPNWCDEVPDSDGDGVKDDMDACPDTPQGTRVDEKGCPLDTDMDGVADRVDFCPDTRIGVRVDNTGCDLDLDGDKVPYYQDRCQNTPPGAEVDQEGCLVRAELGEVLFEFDKAGLTARGRETLDRIADSLQYRDEVTAIVISGHTDSVGSRIYNQRLSEARARNVKAYLTKVGCPKPISARGYGETRPVASNAGAEGRRQNRRVVLELRK